jgi:hypothetical protein
MRFLSFLVPLRQKKRKIDFANYRFLSLEYISTCLLQSSKNRTNVRNIVLGWSFREAQKCELFELSYFPASPCAEDSYDFFNLNFSCSGID